MTETGHRPMTKAHQLNAGRIVELGRTLTIVKPDDWHLHLRDGEMLSSVIEDTSRHFSRAIIMPNLVPPVITTADAKAYRERINSAIPSGNNFTPLMTLYLTEDSNADDIASGFLMACLARLNFTQPVLQPIQPAV